MYGSAEAVQTRPQAKSNAQARRRRRARLGSDSDSDSDADGEDSTSSSSQTVDPRSHSKPWLIEFEKYLRMPSDVMPINEDTDLVQWWGVSHFRSHTNKYSLVGLRAGERATSTQCGHPWRRTIWR